MVDDDMGQVAVIEKARPRRAVPERFSVVASIRLDIIDEEPYQVVNPAPGQQRRVGAPPKSLSLRLPTTMTVRGSVAEELEGQGFIQMASPSTARPPPADIRPALCPAPIPQPCVHHQRRLQGQQQQQRHQWC